jgi:hypothetical protein
MFRAVHEHTLDLSDHGLGPKAAGVLFQLLAVVDAAKR